jgi:signal transduction histidine kinase
MGKPAAVDASFSSCEFCDYIAHELANPLNGMLMSAELIERFIQTGSCAADEIGDLPGILKREIKRLIQLLQELRVSGVLVASELQPVSLPTEIGELLALESAYYAKRGVRVTRHLPVELPCIMGDRDRLRQVILNLCKNAVEAMPNGGTLTLRLTPARNGCAWTLQTQEMVSRKGCESLSAPSRTNPIATASAWRLCVR